MCYHHNGLVSEQKDHEGHPDFISRFIVANNPRRLHLLDGTPWAITASHDGLHEADRYNDGRNSQYLRGHGCSEYSGFEYTLTTFLHALYCIVHNVPSHYELPFDPENHLLPEDVVGRCTLKVIMREAMFFGVMSNSELLQAKYLLARMVLNCADSPALRCLCLCDPDVVLSDPNVFVDTAYDESTYREQWYDGRKDVSLGLHLRSTYRCSMYSEHLYGSALAGYGHTTIDRATLHSRPRPLLRAQVSRFEELLVWAESRAAAHGIKPPYLGGPCAPSPVADAEARAEAEPGDDDPEAADGGDGYPDEDLW